MDRAERKDSNELSLRRSLFMVWRGTGAWPNLHVPARVAQSAEHLSCKQDVEGSIPSSGSHQAIAVADAKRLISSALTPNSASTDSVSQPG